ncbi:MAG: tyrosine-protein phosphatase [Chromatiales bacterium]|nr:tyrosine-protein phosphatase [Chromatiales bacterium]
MIGRLAIAVGVVALAGFGWYGGYADKFGTVGDTGFYRSAQLAPDTLADHIHQQGLRTVINLRGGNPGVDWYDAESVAVRDAGARLVDVKLLQARELPRYSALRELVDALDDAPRPALIHCNAGVDRTGLASILVQLMYTDATLEQARDEVAWHRGVFYPDTVGRQFLAGYTAWLGSREVGHTPARLREYLDTVYVDLDGNVKLWIDYINDATPQGFRDTQVSVSRAGALEISGWAFDDRAGGPLARVDIVVGDREMGTARYGLPSVDLAKHFAKPGVDAARWRFQGNAADLPEGCQPLRLRMWRPGETGSFVGRQQALICAHGAPAG